MSTKSKVALSVDELRALIAEVVRMGARSKLDDAGGIYEMCPDLSVDLWDRLVAAAVGTAEEAES